MTGGGTATVAAELSLTKGSVAGTVAGVGGGSGEGFNVSLYDASSNRRGVTTAGAGGAFAFTDVAVGSYTLFFSDPQGRYFDEYWREQRRLRGGDLRRGDRRWHGDGRRRRVVVDEGVGGRDGGRCRWRFR